MEKQHTATWAEDDRLPRKGPHRMARSSTRRRLYVEVKGFLLVESHGAPITVVVESDDGPHFEVVPALGTYMVPYADMIRDARIYGPAGHGWGQVYGGDSCRRVVHCPTLDASVWPANPANGMAILARAERWVRSSRALRAVILALADALPDDEVEP